MKDIAIKAAFVPHGPRESKCEPEHREGQAGSAATRRAPPSIVKNLPGTRVCNLASSPKAGALNATPSKDIAYYRKSTSETFNSSLGGNFYWINTRQSSSKAWQAFQGTEETEKKSH